MVVHNFDLLHIFEKEQGRVKNFSVFFYIIEGFLNLKFICSNFFVKFWVYAYDAFDLNMFICLFCFNSALPIFIELFQMQVLEMFWADGSKCPIHNFLKLFPKDLLAWIEFDDSVILKNLNLNPRISETLLILIIEIIYFWKNLLQFTHHIDHQVSFGTYDNIVC